MPITEARPRREVGEHDGSAGGGAAQVHERLASRLALLPPLLSPHELKVPPLGLLLVPLPSPPGCLHRRGEEPQRAGPLSVDRSAVGVLDIETVTRPDPSAHATAASNLHPPSTTAKRTSISPVYQCQSTDTRHRLEGRRAATGAEAGTGACTNGGDRSEPWPVEAEASEAGRKSRGWTGEIRAERLVVSPWSLRRCGRAAVPRRRPGGGHGVDGSWWARRGRPCLCLPRAAAADRAARRSADSTTARASRRPEG